MTTVVRFPADLPYDKTLPQLNFYAFKVAAHDEPDPVRKAELEAQANAYFEAHFQDIADSEGAIGYWREKFNTGIVVMPQSGVLVPGATPRSITYPVGMALTFRLGGDGGASASIVAGAEGLYGMVTDVEPVQVGIGQFTAWAKDAIQGLAGKRDQWFTIYSPAPHELSGLADQRLP